MKSRLLEAVRGQSGVCRKLPIRRLLLVAVTLGFSSSSQAALVEIDFDTLPGGGTLVSGSVLTNQYAEWGITFSAIDNNSPVTGESTIVFDDLDPGTGNSGNQWFNCYPDFCTNKAEVLTITFDTPVNNVQWYTDSRGNYPQIQFDAYGATNNLLETVTVGDTSTPNSVLSSFAVSNISRIDASRQSDTNGWSIDNLSFEVTTVPLPAAAYLFGSGLIALIGIVRRRQTA